ncbi:MAG TPA: prolyl oligopeptidase family serine peptidase, partial [Longimicrobiaceae bacterium]|nr:prolyl oligopeptidase family serine peptidase [Longimicrobiaceae bacterium]
MRTSGLALLGTVCLHTLAHAQPRVPQTPRVDSADTYFGTRVPDPYRWLEHYDTPEVRRWYEAENAATDAVLDALPAREAFRRAFVAARRSRPYRVGAPREAGSRVFYTKRLPEEQTPALYVREGDGVERRLFAVAQVADSAAGPTTFGGYFPSPDGSRVIVQYTLGGNERAVGRVVETATGRLLDGPFMAEAVEWTPDGSGFRYRPIRNLGVRASILQLRGGLPIRLHRLDTPFAADAVVFDPIAMGGDSGAIASPHPTGASHVLISLRRPARTQESEIFLATAGEAAGPEARWRRVSVAADSVVLPFVRGGWIYAVSSRGAPNGRLVRTPLARPDWSTAEVVVPESGAVLWEPGVTEERAARDAFYYVRTDSGHQRLFRAPFDGGREREVAMPFEGSIYGLVGDADHDGVSFVFGGWVQPDHLYRYRPAAGRMELLPAFFNPPDPYGELAGLTARTVRIRSHDGVMVPLTILRGPGPQGPRPTILWGYGAYGATIDAFFRPDIRPWLAAGGVYAFCHTQGGGYFGRAWREAGMMQTKPNTWKDGIACAEYLVRQGITTPARLGITGASAGG